MQHSSFLLLDANVIIYLFKIGIWDKLVQCSRLQVARTVLDVEAHFYEDDRGQRCDFDLKQYVDSSAIQIVDCSLNKVNNFISQFDRSYAEKLDPGEAESLAYLLDAPRPTQICSADAIVFRVLGNLDRGEQGRSLEEVLQSAGLSRRLPRQYCRKFREDYTAKGVEERMYGRGLKR